MKDLKLLSPAAAAASAYNQPSNFSYSIHNVLGMLQKRFCKKVGDRVVTAEAAAAATLLLTLVPSTNLSLKAAASVRLSLARSSPSVMY